MTEPNANQQNDSTQQEGTSGLAQPEYGIYKSPEYGALSNQYPADYDPYVYGHPDPPEEKTDDEKSGQSAANVQNTSVQHDPYGNPFKNDGSGATNQQGQTGQNGPYGNPYNQGGYGPNYGANYGQNGQTGQNQQGAYQNQQPYGWQNPNQYTGNAQGNSGNPNEPNLNDPNQNPLYGRWDVYAILAFIFSFFSVPLLPALMGAVAIWRTRTFHMKGMGLAVAAVVINLLYTITVVWMTINGMSTIDLYQDLLGGTGGTIVDDGSITA